MVQTINCSEKQQILTTKMQRASNLRIKKLYGKAATQNYILADLEDAYFGYSIKYVRIIDLKHKYDKM